MTRTYFFAFLVAPTLVLAQGTDSSDDEENQIAAMVEGEPIYTGEVDREVAKVTQNRAVAPQAMKPLQAQALQQLVKRRLVLRYLNRKGLGASDEDVALAIARVKEQLKSQNLTLEAYLESAGLSDREFRQAFVWQLSWQRYLDRYLTDKNLESYFNRHRREFDGTELQVAHILLKVPADGGQQTWQETEQRAAQIREEIVAQAITFAEAAEKYSQSPTAANGGDIGFISRHKPMPESFSQAAFALHKGEISQPVTTPFGVHLIRCVDVKPAEKTWQEARDQLKLAVTRFLFDWVAEQERASENVQLNFTGKTPYFRPETGELVAE